MVVKPNVQKAADEGGSPGRGDVVLAGAGIAAWMIVDHDEAGRPQLERAVEYLA